MTTIYETTDRLIGEHVDELLALAWDIDEQLRPMSAEADERGHRPTMPFVRLIAAVHLLYQQHGVDAKGAAISVRSARECGAPEHGHARCTQP